MTVHYELYDGLPVLCKWMTVRNGSRRALNLDAFASEMLAVVEAESAVDDRKEWRHPLITFLSDYSFHGMDVTTASQTAAWLPDPQYTSQVNYSRKMPALLVSQPPLGPDLQLQPGESFESYRTYVVAYDSDGRERQGLTIRHVNPQLPQKAMAVVYNPLDCAIERSLILPLYYSGVTDVARIREQENRPQKYKLDREYQVTVRVHLPPKGVTWFVVE